MYSFQGCYFLKKKPVEPSCWQNKCPILKKLFRTSATYAKYSLILFLLLAFLLCLINTQKLSENKVININHTSHLIVLLLLQFKTTAQQAKTSVTYMQVKKI